MKNAWTEEIDRLRRDNKILVSLNDTFPEEIARLEDVIDRLRAENKELKGVFSELDDPEKAFILYRGKYIIQRVEDYDAELKRYYAARDRVKEGG